MCLRCYFDPLDMFIEIRNSGGLRYPYYWYIFTSMVYNDAQYADGLACCGCMYPAPGIPISEPHILKLTPQKSLMAGSGFRVRGLGYRARV